MGGLAYSYDWVDEMHQALAGAVRDLVDLRYFLCSDFSRERMPWCARLGPGGSWVLVGVPETRVSGVCMHVYTALHACVPTNVHAKQRCVCMRTKID